MSSLFDHPAVHPVLACAEALEAALKETADVQVVFHVACGEGFMSPAEKRVALLRLARVEAQLVAQPAEFGPRELRVLGRRVLDIVAPEIGEAHEAEQLAAEERRAERRTSLTSKRLGDGSTRIAINVPDAVATRLHTYLEVFTSPRHPAGVWEWGRATGSRSTANAGRRSARCSKHWTRSGCRPMVGMPPP